MQNGQNTKSLRRDNTTGYRGVWWEKRLQKWRATATYKGKLYSAGYFDDLEDAGEAARQLRLKLYTHNDADRRKETNT